MRAQACVCQVAQTCAAAADEVAQMGRVVAHQRALGVAARVDVVGADAGLAGGDPGPQQELRRDRARAGAGAVVALGRADDGAVVAVMPALGQQAHGGAAREAIERVLGLRVAGGGGAVERVRVGAGGADRAGPVGGRVRSLHQERKSRDVRKTKIPGFSGSRRLVRGVRGQAVAVRHWRRRRRRLSRIPACGRSSRPSAAAEFMSFGGDHRAS